MKKIAVAMSGGVDSSVAALLLSRQKSEVFGITMLTGSSSAATESVVRDARQVCEILGLEHHVVELTEVFRKCVIANFCAQYAVGRTPNPCLECNRYVKFGALMERALSLGARYLATGHYARIERACDRWLLKTALEKDKDQSYVLFALSQQQLAQTLLPLGRLGKAEVRDLAKKAGLPVFEKPESQDICFAGEDTYVEFLQNHGSPGLTPGPIVDTTGRELGRHQGLVRYTVGQRKGLGISAERPLYVLRLRYEDNAVVVGHLEESYVPGMEISACNWIFTDHPDEEFRAEVKIRYRSSRVGCTVTLVGGSKAQVRFDSAQRAVAPGQAAVFYKGDDVLGGGAIDRPLL